EQVLPRRRRPGKPLDVVAPEELADGGEPLRGGHPASFVDEANFPMVRGLDHAMGLPPIARLRVIPLLEERPGRVDLFPVELDGELNEGAPLAPDPFGQEAMPAELAWVASSPCRQGECQCDGLQ